MLTTLLAIVLGLVGLYLAVYVLWFFAFGVFMRRNWRMFDEAREAMRRDFRRDFPR